MKEQAANRSTQPRPTGGSTLRERPEPARNPNPQSGLSNRATQITDNDLANGIGTGRSTMDPTDRNGRGGRSGESSPGFPTANEGYDNGTSSPSRNMAATPPAQNKPNSPESDAPKLTPFDPGYDFSADRRPLSADPFAQAEDPTATAVPNPNDKRERPSGLFNVTRLAQQAQQAQSRLKASEEPASSQSNMEDWKKKVNELGLGPVLKRIYEKTLKEQGLNANQPAGASTDKSNNLANNPARLPNLPKPGDLSPEATEQLKKWAESAANNSSTNSNRNSATSSTSSTASASSAAWGKWFRDTWQSVSDASTRAARNSSSQSSSTASAPTASPAAPAMAMPELRWTNSMTLAVLLAVVLVVWLYWFSRLRVSQLSDPTAAQAEWVRTVVSQGLKTRADVIRAFHQLVKQSRAVSDWWTHRSIVRYFNHQTPQVAAAISELAVVYEQARYYPEDVELSPQQLAQVRSLLESVKIPNAKV